MKRKVQSTVEFCEPNFAFRSDNLRLTFDN